MILLSLSFSS